MEGGEGNLKHLTVILLIRLQPKYDNNYHLQIPEHKHSGQLVIGVGSFTMLGKALSVEVR